MALPLYLRIGDDPVDSRFSRDILYCLIAFIFTIIFYKNDSKYGFYKIFFVILAVYSYVVQWNQASFAVINQWINVCCFCMLSITLISVGDKINKKYLFYTILAIGLIQSLWVAIEYSGVNIYALILDAISPGKYLRVSRSGEIIKDITAIGSMGNVNLTASVIAICFPVVLFSNRYIIAPCIILLSIGLLICNSAMGYITALSSIVLVLIYKKKYLISFCALILSTLAITIVPHGTLSSVSSGRLEVWAMSHDYFEKIDTLRLLFGQGLGFFSDHFGAIKGVVFKQAHNEFIDCIYAYGLVGLLAFLSLFTWIIIRSKSALASIILISMCVNMIGHFTLHISTTAFIFSILIAICINSREDI